MLDAFSRKFFRFACGKGLTPPAYARRQRRGRPLLTAIVCCSANNRSNIAWPQILRPCSAFWGESGDWSLLWDRLPVFKGYRLFFTVRFRPQTNPRLHRSHFYCNRREKHRPGFAVKGGAGQVQGPRPCRGSKGAQPFAGRDRAKTCADGKVRAGAAKKVPQNRPLCRAAHGLSRKAIFAENSRPESSDGSRIG